MFTQKQIIAGISGLVLIILAILVFFFVIQKGESQKQSDAEANKPIFSVGENTVPKKWADEYREKVLKVPTDCKGKEEECKGARELADRTLLNTLGGAVRDHQVAKEHNIKYKGEKYDFYINSIQLNGTEKQLSPELQRYLKESRFIAAQVLSVINKKAKKTFLTKRELDKIFEGKEDLYNSPERRNFGIMVFPNQDNAERVRAGLLSGQITVEDALSQLDREHRNVSTHMSDSMPESGFTKKEAFPFFQSVFKGKVGSIPPVKKHKMTQKEINFFYEELAQNRLSSFFKQPKFFIFPIHNVQEAVSRNKQETKALMAQNIEQDRRQEYVKKEVEKKIKKSTEAIKCDSNISVKCEIQSLY